MGGFAPAPAAPPAANPRPSSAFLLLKTRIPAAGLVYRCPSGTGLALAAGTHGRHDHTHTRAVSPSKCVRGVLPELRFWTPAMMARRGERRAGAKERAECGS